MSGPCDGQHGKHYQYAQPAAPAVTSVTPDHGTTVGGTSVTIVGTRFVSVEEVLFGTVPAADFVVTDDTHITAHTPAHGAGTVDVRVRNELGTSPVVVGDHYLYEVPLGARKAAAKTTKKASKKAAADEVDPVETPGEGGPSEPTASSVGSGGSDHPSSDDNAANTVAESDQGEPEAES